MVIICDKFWELNREIYLWQVQLEYCIWRKGSKNGPLRCSIAYWNSNPLRQGHKIHSAFYCIDYRIRKQLNYIALVPRLLYTSLRIGTNLVMLLKCLIKCIKLSDYLLMIATRTRINANFTLILLHRWAQEKFWDLQNINSLWKHFLAFSEFLKTHLFVLLSQVWCSEPNSLSLSCPWLYHCPTLNLNVILIWTKMI